MTKSEQQTIGTISMVLGKELRIAQNRVARIEERIEHDNDTYAEYDSQLRKLGLDTIMSPCGVEEIDDLDIAFWVEQSHIDKLQKFVDKVQELIDNWEPPKEDDDDDYNDDDCDEDNDDEDND